MRLASWPASPLHFPHTISQPRCYCVAGAGPSALQNGQNGHAEALHAPCAATAAGPPRPLANGNGHAPSGGAPSGAGGAGGAAQGQRAGSLDLASHPSGELGACEGELGAFELVAPAAAPAGGDGPRAAPPPPPLSLEEWGSFLTSEGAWWGLPGHFSMHIFCAPLSLEERGSFLTSKGTCGVSQGTFS